MYSEDLRWPSYAEIKLGNFYLKKTEVVGILIPPDLLPVISADWKI